MYIWHYIILNTYIYIYCVYINSHRSVYIFLFYLAEYRIAF